jgi:hypothetical protein
MSSASKGEKSKNGQAKSLGYLLTFDEKDEAELRAWRMCQQLASQRQLKRTLLGFLLALDDIRRYTQRDTSVEEMMARFVSSMIMDPVGIRPSQPLPIGDLSEEAPPLIVGSAHHADPDQARQQLALDVGDLFGDDE